MLLIFDEARYLTDTSAIDGKRMPSQAEYQEEANVEVGMKPSEHDPLFTLGERKPQVVDRVLSVFQFSGTPTSVAFDYADQGISWISQFSCSTNFWLDDGYLVTFGEFPAFPLGGQLHEN